MKINTANIKPIHLIVILFLIIGLLLLLNNARKPQTTRSDASEAQVNNTPQGNVRDPNIREIEGRVPDRLKDFPVYPNATIEESYERINTIESNQDLKVEWITKGPVVEVMDWYLKELPENGWTVEPPDDLTAAGEQIAQIKKGNLEGYIAVEDEGGVKTEIIVDFKVIRK